MSGHGQGDTAVSVEGEGLVFHEVVLPQWEVSLLLKVQWGLFVEPDVEALCDP